ncbi:MULTISPECIES: hypothetical protein [Paenibacillus]|uniref:hypothetical protein n=1 Tax=Paenibacillus TaxID=44249 RepID=UPI00096BE198|nr:hypothetical protein [Paenibacillus odorifer]OME29245.1 hypothetical protein BSK63_22290 [Paenibacillus odorifer]OME31068.1 hypothetical protein BSK58_29715 [Paenibacillus odorifer]OME34897.1 hypothetical protein BSK46_20325 [Paenibacillus odorifer]OME45839.1 hypothetical protein BSK59_31260 [Paenibacillus odorifer]
MKKLILVLVAVVIISNAIWSYLYFNKEFETNLNTGVQVYTLKGTGDTWDVLDYKIIISSSKILRGHGKLVFKGDPSALVNSSYYKYEVNEKNTNNKDETVLVNEARSTDGPVSILSNTDIGSITGPYSYDELNKNRQNYENTTLSITWNDNEGEIHSETISLDIESEISLKDDL